MNGNDIKNGEHKAIWEAIQGIKDILNNHISTRIDKIEGRIDKLFFLMPVGIAAPLTLWIILKILKIV